MKQFSIKRLTIALIYCLLSLSVSASELYTAKAVLNDGDQLVAEVRFDTTESGDLYVAVILDDVLWFYTTAGFTTKVEPFKRGQTYQGNYPIFNFKAEEIPAGQYTLYQVVTLVGTNPLDLSNWQGGLHSLKFTVGLPDKQSGDNNGDGFPDGDDNHNGFVDNTESETLPATLEQYILLSFNDLGMHCMDKDFSVFSILPPYNVVNAQVLKQGTKPSLLNSDKIEVRYSPIPDSNGSLNSYSVGKTNFWAYANQLFNTELPLGQGLSGNYMPGDSDTTPNFKYDTAEQWFQAAGIPITSIDDNGATNPYPMLRISAHDKQTGELLTMLDIVVPVSQETDCKNCHATGQVATQQTTGITWSNEADLEIQAKWNILHLHDAKHATELAAKTPVLCASCHYSAALDLAKEGPQGFQNNFPTMSRVMHGHHGKLQQNGTSVFPNGGKSKEDCYQCHPGAQTQCQRGAMSKTVECQNCHGDMLSVGGEYPLSADGSLNGQNDNKQRRPWIDLPRCQSCHTGDAVDHLSGDRMKMHSDGIRLTQTYLEGDQSASPITAQNQRFAENPDTLFRNSKGHGGVACEGCHGSTHAIWANPIADASDNIAATQLQGHTGTLIECQTCHGDSLAVTTNGPHGMHNVNDMRWTNHQHSYSYKRNAEKCQACHGIDLKGTPLAKMAETRTFRIEGKNITLNQGKPVACNHCHSLPH